MQLLGLGGLAGVGCQVGQPAVGDGQVPLVAGVVGGGGGEPLCDGQGLAVQLLGLLDIAVFLGEVPEHEEPQPRGCFEIRRERGEGVPGHCGRLVPRPSLVELGDDRLGQRGRLAALARAEQVIPGFQQVMNVVGRGLRAQRSTRQFEYSAAARFARRAWPGSRPGSRAASSAVQRCTNTRRGWLSPPASTVSRLLSAQA